MIFKIGFLENFANFKGKHLRWNLSLIKLQVFRPTATTGLCLYPLKTSEHLGCSDVFRGYKKSPVAWIALIIFFYSIVKCNSGIIRGNFLALKKNFDTGMTIPVLHYCKKILLKKDR